MDFILGCIDKGLLLLLTLPPLLLSKRLGLHRFCGSNGFPMHAWRFDLRFNVVPILWTLLVIFHGRLGWFEAHIIEVLFLASSITSSAHAVARAVASQLRFFIRARLINGTNLHTCTNSSSTELFPHLRLLFRTFLQMYMYFELADVHQCDKVDFPCCCFVSFFKNLVSFLFHCCLCVWNQHCLEWMIFCTYSRFPEASVSERQISRIVWTIRDSRFVCVHTQDSLSRTISEVCTTFFTSQHLRVSRTLQFFGVTWRNLSHRYAVSPDETTCASFHQKMWRAFFWSFHRTEFVYQSCNIIQNSVFLLQHQYNCILLQTLWLLLFWNNGFPYACSGTRSFAWNSSFSITPYFFLDYSLFLFSSSCFPNSYQATYHVQIIKISSISHRIGFFLLEEFRSIT